MPDDEKRNKVRVNLRLDAELWDGVVSGVESGEAKDKTAYVEDALRAKQDGPARPRKTPARRPAPRESTVLAAKAKVEAAAKPAGKVAPRVSPRLMGKNAAKPIPKGAK